MENFEFNKGAKFQCTSTERKRVGLFFLVNLSSVDQHKFASKVEEILVEGDTPHNEPLVPHQVICLEKGELIEVSTPDSVEDDYRVGKGDSQE